MNSNKKNKKKVSSVILVLIAFVYSFQVISIFNIPSNMNLYKGDKKNINIAFPFTIDVLESKDKVLNLEDSNDKFVIRNSYQLSTHKEGKTNLNIKLLGLVPVKTMEVNIMDRIKLYPGGQSIGVKLNTDGVLIVAVSDIVAKDGKKYIPSKEAGIKIGDSILEINNIKVKDSYHVMDILNNIGNKEVKVKVRRDDQIFTTEIKPIKSKEDGSYRIGLWVRDKTAGIGTLTFYHPNSKKFAALGHGISDIDTGKLMTISDGEILEARISSIEQGQKGHPGELRGMFFDSQNLLGKIEKNTAYGIYGDLTESLKDSYYKKPLPIALQHEIKEGKAKILSTVNGKEIKEYEVEIVKLENQLNISPKSMVIKVTDKELLSKTGGIVQGMSGSPIIQDGKIIGAVTHVFVNDPTKGYGLYIEWMLDQAGLMDNEISKEKTRESLVFSLLNYKIKYNLCIELS